MTNKRPSYPLPRNSAKVAAMEFLTRAKNPIAIYHVDTFYLVVIGRCGLFSTCSWLANLAYEPTRLTIDTKQPDTAVSTPRTGPKHPGAKPRDFSVGWQFNREGAMSGRMEPIAVPHYWDTTDTPELSRLWATKGQPPYTCPSYEVIHGSYLSRGSACICRSNRLVRYIRNF